MFPITDSQIEEFQVLVLGWFRENGRHFAWRNASASNYQRIISEVLLQRTKAETVAKYFPVFLRKYPSWKQLGEATEEELQDILRPLGLYKQRGGRMYKLAQEMKRRGGRFPNKRAVVEDISMFGQYIANAYEMFILKRPAPLLDVNMARVLERYFGPRKLADIRYDPYLQELAKRVVDHPQFKEINWAILDFGALVCKANVKACPTCVLRFTCKTGISEGAAD